MEWNLAGLMGVVEVVGGLQMLKRKKGFGRRADLLQMWGFEITKHSFYYTLQTFGPPLFVQTFADVVRRLQTFYI
ncbi:hypothetical protein HanHA300_Chr04g0145641 [Helianthus annuus]|nr:hypothetical protein HanHA300_Chr04g0145641 [Helianthus annuus]KAJ0762103.1 hypothetical protein HanOQP8_Chr04g0157671 [Helianthus annuus]